MHKLPSTEWLREFQRKLHEKANAERKFRFYSLYDKTYRIDVLAEAYGKAKANGGASGIDGETKSQQRFRDTVRRYVHHSIPLRAKEQGRTSIATCVDGWDTIGLGMDQRRSMIWLNL